jgi:Prokaryotic homologs of the JAB domain
MLFGEHVAEDEFRVIEATAHAVGLVASFVRVIADGFARLEQFFRRTRHDYTHFNYLGEWHSHPLFALHPSSTDAATMQRLVEEPATKALFVVLVIVKLEGSALRAGAWAFFPGLHPQTCTVTFDGEV